MVTAIIGGIILVTFSILFYLEDRAGGGIYDPDPSAFERHRKRK
jgi:hypothetical protein